MPEGDTVHKVANVIRADLVGHIADLLYVRGTASSDLFRFQNLQVRAVEAIGKHLLVTFANAWVLRVHLGMHGSWNRFPAPSSGAPVVEKEAPSGRFVPSAARLRAKAPAVGGLGRLGTRPRPDTGVILQGPETLLVCEGPKEVELFEERLRYRHPEIRRLGPDLLAPEVDYDVILGRLKQCHQPAIADLLVDQRVACGLGNVYRNELCFLGAWEGEMCRPGRGIYPYHPWRQLDEDTILGLYRRGRELLWANMGGWPRTTTFDARKPGAPPVNAKVRRRWVYGCTGQKCTVCGTIILSAHEGDYARATQWCPRCQPI